MWCLQACPPVWGYWTPWWAWVGGSRELWGYAPMWFSVMLRWLENLFYCVKYGHLPCKECERATQYIYTTQGIYSTKSFILLPCEAWAPTLVEVLNKQDFCLYQVLGQHWSAMQACSVSPGSHPHQKFPHHFPLPTAASASADEAACTWQPHLRLGCRLHAVSSLDVVVAHCIETDCLLTSCLHTLHCWPFPTICPNMHCLSLHALQHHCHCARSSTCIAQTHVRWTPCIVVWFLMGHIPHLLSRWWVMGGWPWGMLTQMQMVHVWMAWTARCEGCLRYFYQKPVCCEVCLRYFTKSLCATVFMQTVYSTVIWGKQQLGLWQGVNLINKRKSVMYGCNCHVWLWPWSWLDFLNLAWRVLSSRLSRTSLDLYLNLGELLVI